MNKKRSRRMRDGDTSFYKYDNITGFWGIPNKESEIYYDLNPNKSFVARHNSDGNRDIEFNPDKNKKTIVCLGGSHSWGIAVDDAERYSDLVRELLDCNVVNMAHPSLGLDQIALALFTKVQKLSPDIVIVEQYPWAIHRIITTYVNGYFRPGFKISENGKLCRKEMPPLAKFKIFRSFVGAYYQYEKQFSEYRSGIDLSKNYDPLSDPIFLVWRSHHYDYMYKLAEKIITKMNEYCINNKIKMVFVLGVVKQQYESVSKSKLIDYGLPRKRLIHILSKNNVCYLDMLPSMLSQNSLNEPVAFSDGHINAKGHKIFAEQIQHYLNDKGWL